MNLVLALVLLPGLLNGALQSQAGSPARQIEGTVVAYSPFSRLTIIVGSYQPSTKRSFQESFLLRLDHNYVDLKKGQLIQLKYDGETGSKPELPKELFEHNGHWTFEATKDDGCTTTLEEVLYYRVDGQLYSNMQYASWTKPLKLPLTTVVPCYVVASGGFTKL